MTPIQSMPFDTPVAFIIFRRADLTYRALQAISQVKPRQLFVIADGPRPDCPDDIPACAAARAVIEQIDWDCEIHKCYSEVNLGCGRRPATGITWLFEQVEEAIILEDDCLPDPSFFYFCQEMLKRYRNDERVMNVGGSNYQRESLPIVNSYLFSRLPGCVGGWATWRRAWDFFDYDLTLWLELRNSPFLDQILDFDVIVKFYEGVFDEAVAAHGDVCYWDHQWSLACWANRGLAIVPKVNLVSNIGWGPEATHTPNSNHPALNIPAHAMPFPLQHPSRVLDDVAIDRQWLLAQSQNLQKRPIRLNERLRNRLVRLVKNCDFRVYSLFSA